MCVREMVVIAGTVAERASSEQDRCYILIYNRGVTRVHDRGALA